MSLLRAGDLRAVLGYAESALTVKRFAEVEPLLLGRLADVVGCEAATLTHLDLRSQREVAVLWPAARAAATPLERYAGLGSTHPLRPTVTQRLRERRLDGPPLRISDVLGRREWREHPLRREVMPDVDDQMSLPVRARGGAVHVVAVARSGRPFSDRQRELLGTCAGHLAAALRRVRRDGQHALQIAPTLRWVPAVEAPGLADRAGALSDREREVLALVAAGLTDAQVARSLGLRPATVSKHLHRIYGRLELPNRVAAVRYWSGDANVVGASRTEPG
jgi:DNA-binding CsgD family transcriptional regulator